MLPAVAQCVGVTSAHPYRGEQAHRLNLCAVTLLLLSCAILVDTSRQALSVLFSSVILTHHSVPAAPFCALALAAVSSGCQPAVDRKSVV